MLMRPRCRDVSLFQITIAYSHTMMMIHRHLPFGETILFLLLLHGLQLVCATIVSIVTIQAGPTFATNVAQRIKHE